MIQFRFPNNFLWGTATSSFQIEGGPRADGKGPSIWDEALCQSPEKFSECESPLHAANFYHQYPEDIRMMKELGLKSFRLSIAWPRIFPSGYGKLNDKGLDFYDRLIDSLLEQEIEPLVDLYHWDLPQALADEGGFKNPRIIDHFLHYAEVCFNRYGNRVKYWSTMNEPSVIAFTHYFSGIYPPYEKNLAGALAAGHHLLLSHFRIVRLYRQLGLKGKIGSVVAFVPVYPNSFSPPDQQAATRRQDFISGWWLDPMFLGRYPDSVTQHPSVSDSLPKNYSEQLQQAFAPMDFVGINYYTPARAGYKPGEFLDVEHVETYYAQTEYRFITYAPGLFDTVMYVGDRYGNPEIFITENGLSHDSKTITSEQNGDQDRIRYIREHLREIVRSIRAGAKIRGYYYWSLFDTFEATSGYRYRFGLMHVDFKTLERTCKPSWFYYQKCIQENSVD